MESVCRAVVDQPFNTCLGLIFEQEATADLGQLAYETLSVAMEALARQPQRYRGEDSVMRLPADLFQDTLPGFAKKVQAALLRGSSNADLLRFVESAATQNTQIKKLRGACDICEAIVYTCLTTVSDHIAGWATSGVVSSKATQRAIEECSTAKLMRSLFQGSDEAAHYAVSFLKNSGAIASFEIELQAAFSAILDQCTVLASRVMGNFDDYYCRSENLPPGDLPGDLLCGAHDQLKHSADTIRHLLASIKTLKVRSKLLC